MNERIRHWAYFTAQPCALEIPPWKEGRKEGRSIRSLKIKEGKGREGKVREKGMEWREVSIA